MGSLEGRVAVVTGGASGIGLAIASRLTEDGASVGSLDLASGVDVADAAAVRDAVARIARELGPPTIAVHCAAVQHMLPFDELDEEEWERTWRVNVGGAVNLVHAVVPGMRAAGAGRIVLVSSSSVVTPPPGLAHYIATKSGLIGLARGLASEYGADGITVNAVAPGLTRTENALATLPPGHWDVVRSRQAVPRNGEPEDQAAAVAFLVSDEASFITGQTLLVDGGEGRI
ncbi:MAG: SDR family oxidoreductase [Microbacteriaceae bacterium]|nr:SDR family oxidoreductase [Microbacteriaceae bacterium]